MLKLNTRISFATSTENLDGKLVQDIDNAGILDSAENNIANAVVEHQLDVLKIFEWIFVDVEFNTSNKQGKYLETQWRKNRNWKKQTIRGAPVFSASINMNVRPWSRSKNIPKENWLGLDSLNEEFERIGRLVIAQIALDLGEVENKISNFISTTAVNLKELSPDHLDCEVDGKPELFNLEIEIIHGLSNMDGNLSLRGRLGQALSDVIEEHELGECSGSAGGEEHFEFGFVVNKQRKHKHWLIRY